MCLSVALAKGKIIGGRKMLIVLSKYLRLCCSRKRKLSSRNIAAAVCKHTFTDFLLPGSILMVATLRFQADKEFHRSDNTLGVFRYQLWSRTINVSHGCVPACRSITMFTRVHMPV